MPSPTTMICQDTRSENPGARRATRKMPALTIAAACRYALTGVGAAIAPGSQKWNGKMADLLNAPIRISTIAMVTDVPAGGSATISDSEIRAGDLTQDDDADQHGQAAGGGDQQGLGRGPATGGAYRVEADEQERQDRRQFPEDVEHQHVVAADQAEHGAREGDHLATEAGDPASGLAEVLGAIAEHQRADPEHQDRHDRGQGVEPQVDVHLQRGHPGDRFGADAAGIRSGQFARTQMSPPKGARANR